MRTVAMPGRTTGVVVCEWQRLGGRLSARWRYASQPSALQAGRQARSMASLRHSLRSACTTCNTPREEAMTAGAREHALQSMSRAQRRPRSLSA